MRFIYLYFFLREIKFTFGFSICQPVICLPFFTPSHLPIISPVKSFHTIPSFHPRLPSLRPPHPFILFFPTTGYPSDHCVLLLSCSRCINFTKLRTGAIIAWCVDSFCVSLCFGLFVLCDKNMRLHFIYHSSVILSCVTSCVGRVASGRWYPLRLSLFNTVSSYWIVYKSFRCPWVFFWCRVAVIHMVLLPQHSMQRNTWGCFTFFPHRTIRLRLLRLFFSNNKVLYVHDIYLLTFVLHFQLDPRSV